MAVIDIRIDEDQVAAATGAPTPAAASPASAPSVAPGRRTRTRWGTLARLLGFDVLALCAALLVAPGGVVFALVTLAGVPLALRLADLYGRGAAPSALDHVGPIARATASAVFVSAAVSGLAAATALRWALIALAALLVGRTISYSLERRSVTRRPRRAVIVGTGAAGQELCRRLLDHPDYGLVPFGFVDSQPDPIDPSLPVSVVGDLDDLSDIVRRLDIGRVIVDGTAISESDLPPVLDRITRLGVEISVLPALAQHLSTAISVEGIAGTTLLSYRPSARQGISWMAKRVVDVVGATALIVATAPIWALTAIAIRLDSRGPVMFRQERIGRFGEPFTLYKFRSMDTDAEARKAAHLATNEAHGPYFKMCDDPRITRVGRVIRRLSIDELPQLLNVVRGHMSLVGPRPALPEEVAEYPNWFRRRLTVPPGLSGLWQVSGRFLLPFDEACRLDVFYVDHWSLGLDLKIIARTPSVLLAGHGAR